MSESSIQFTLAVDELRTIKEYTYLESALLEPLENAFSQAARLRAEPKRVKIALPQIEAKRLQEVVEHYALTGNFSEKPTKHLSALSQRIKKAVAAYEISII